MEVVLHWARSVMCLSTFELRIKFISRSPFMTHLVTLDWRFPLFLSGLLDGYVAYQSSRRAGRSVQLSQITAKPFLGMRVSTEMRTRDET